MMADKDQPPNHSTEPFTNGRYARSDAESASAGAGATVHSRKNRKKCLLYIALFAIFQTGIILIFALTIMKVRTPKLRLRSATLSNLSVGTAGNPSLRAAATAEISIRNANFGRYRYQDTSVEFFYGGEPAARATVRGSRVGWRSRKNIELDVDLNLGTSAGLGTDLSNGIVPLTAQARMRGRVDLIFVMRKNKSTAMNCSMEIVVATRLIQNIICK